jgi:NADH:ubiquinone oxidoreductase subunit 4 (subunit M)
VPEVFDHGRLGPAILFSAPQLGAYVTVVLIVPRAAPEVLRLIAILALCTAVYGAALALVQTSARRACGYLFVSQSALIMAGLDGTSVSALAGGLLLWLSAGVAFAGLARCVLVLEARADDSILRRSTADTSGCRYWRSAFLRWVWRAPGSRHAQLRRSGIARRRHRRCLSRSRLRRRRRISAYRTCGLAHVLRAVLRSSRRARRFRRDSSGLTRREAWTFALVVIVLVGLGIVPRPIVDSRFTASEQILRLRDARASADRAPRRRCATMQ